MRDLLWITPLEAAAVAVATTGMYVAMVLLVRLLGQRMMSSMSSYDLAAVLAFGAVMGRASLGEAPVLGGGLVALSTLVVLQGFAGLVRSTQIGERTVSRRPVLLMAGGTVIDAHLRACHVKRSELWSKLRLAGVRAPDEVGAVVFEPSGQVSVLRRDAPIDPQLLQGVVGWAMLPVELRRQPDER